MYAQQANDEINLNLAVSVAKRGDCRYRNFGAVIVQDNEVITTGHTSVQAIDRRKKCTQCIGSTGLPEVVDCSAKHAAVVAISLAQKKLNGATLYLAGVQMHNGVFDRVLDSVRPCGVCSAYISSSGVSTVVCRDKGELIRIPVSQLSAMHEAVEG